jgi:hypothetical protein
LEFLLTTVRWNAPWAEAPKAATSPAAAANANPARIRRLESLDWLMPLSPVA